MPKKPRAALLIEKRGHETDYTLSTDGLEIDRPIVEYGTEQYEYQDFTHFDGSDAVIAYEIPNPNPARVTAAKRAHGAK